MKFRVMFGFCPSKRTLKLCQARGLPAARRGPRASAGGDPGLCTVQDTAQGYLGPSLTPSESIPTPK